MMSAPNEVTAVGIHPDDTDTRLDAVAPSAETRVVVDPYHFREPVTCEDLTVVKGGGVLVRSYIDVAATAVTLADDTYTPIPFGTVHGPGFAVHAGGIGDDPGLDYTAAAAHNFSGFFYFEFPAAAGGVIYTAKITTTRGMVTLTREVQFPEILASLSTPVVASGTLPFYLELETGDIVRAYISQAGGAGAALAFARTILDAWQVD